MAGMIEVVGIVLDRERRLLYRSKDLMEAERTLGHGFVEALGRPGVLPLAVFLKVGLQHEDEKLSLDRTQKLIDLALRRGDTFSDLWNRIGEALMKSGWLKPPTPEEGAADADPLAVPIPGS